jgi:uncharacterized protein involved in type VI secretion and phage assembly
MQAGKTDRDNGIVIGITQDLDDPMKLGRIRVTFPHLNGAMSDWAWIVSPMAGKNRGLFLRPEPGDQVLVAYAQGDPRFPYIVGSVWSKTDPPPSDDGKPAENNWRFLRSRSGHVVKLDDTKGSEKIEIVDQTGALAIRLDSSKKSITVNNDGGDVDVTSSTGNVSVSASAGKISLQGATIEVTATASLKLSSSGVVTIKGSMVEIN